MLYIGLSVALIVAAAATVRSAVSLDPDWRYPFAGFVIATVAAFQAPSLLSVVTSCFIAGYYACMATVWKVSHR